MPGERYPPAAPGGAAGPGRAILAAMDEAGRLLEFAKGARVPGGFGWLGDDGRPDPARGTPLWISARMTHCFALGVLLEHPGSAAYADHGLAALPPEGGEDAYAHAFVILAGASAAVAGRPGADEVLAEALAVTERRFWREAEGAVADDEPYRGANANMHMVEAFLAAADASGDPVWAERALRIADRLIGAARAADWRVPEHFDAALDAASRTTTRTSPAIRSAPTASRPATGSSGRGCCCTCAPRSTRRPTGSSPPRAGWPTARGPTAGTRSAAASSTPPTTTAGRSSPTASTGWSARRSPPPPCSATRSAGAGRATFAEQHLIDRERGGWRHELDPENRPAARTWQGRPDVYHALQATLIPGLPVRASVAGALR